MKYEVACKLAWAEVYTGTGRFTGYRADEPVRMDNGDVAPGWVWVGDMTEEEYWDAVEADSLT